MAKARSVLDDVKLTAYSKQHVFYEISMLWGCRQLLADDFFPHGNRPASFPLLSPALENARKRAHKQVSHLTTGRLDEGDPGKTWQFAALTREILNVLVEFARLASQSKLDSSVRDFILELSKATP